MATDSTNLPQGETTLDAGIDMTASDLDLTTVQLAQTEPANYVDLPKGNTVILLPVQPGQTVRLPTDSTNGVLAKIGPEGNLALVIDGRTIILQGFLKANDQSPIKIVTSDGDAVNVAELVAATDPSLDIQTAAGPASGDQGDTDGSGIYIPFLAGPGLGGLDALGILDPTALQYRLIDDEFKLFTEEEDTDPRDISITFDILGGIINEDDLPGDQQDPDFQLALVVKDLGNDGTGNDPFDTKDREDQPGDEDGVDDVGGVDPDREPLVTVATVKVNFGPDVPGTLWLDKTELPDGLKSGGEEITYEVLPPSGGQGNGIVGYVESGATPGYQDDEDRLVFDVKVQQDKSSSIFEVNFTLYDNIDNTPPDANKDGAADLLGGNEQILDLPVKVTAKDSDGSTLSTVMHLGVEDDVPFFGEVGEEGEEGILVISNTDADIAHDETEGVDGGADDQLEGDAQTWVDGAEAKVISAGFGLPGGDSEGALEPIGVAQTQVMASFGADQATQEHTKDPSSAARNSVFGELEDISNRDGDGLTDGENERPFELFMTVGAGAPGAIETQFKNPGDTSLQTAHLSIADQETNTTVTWNGQQPPLTVYLHQVDAQTIVGYVIPPEGQLPEAKIADIDGVNGEAVFVLTIDDQGVMTFVQYHQLNHPDAGDGSNGTHDEPFTIKAADGSDLIQVRISDYDGDHAHQPVNLVIQDDGPVFKQVEYDVCQTEGGVEPTDVFEHFDDLSGWTVLPGGNATIVNGIGTSDPQPNPNKQALLIAQGGDQAGIESFFGLPSGALDAVADDGNADNGTENPTDGSAIKKTFNVNAGDVLTLKFNFLEDESDGEGGDDAPGFQDFAFIVIGDQIFRLSNVGDADNPSSANSGGFSWDEESGYLTFTYTFTASGPVQVGFGVMDESDEVVDPGLLIDELKIGPGCEGAIDEDALPNGIEGGPGDGVGGTSVGGNIKFDFGVDRPGLLSIDGLTIADDKGAAIAFADLKTADGNGVVWGSKSGPDADGWVTWTAIEDGTDDPVFVFKLDTSGPGQGDFVFELQQALDHPFTDDPADPVDTNTAWEDNLHFNFNVKATDVDGDWTSGNVKISVDDDSPTAKCDIDCVTEGKGNTATGNVVSGVNPENPDLGTDANGTDGNADQLSQDTPHTISKLTHGGHNYTLVDLGGGIYSVSKDGGAPGALGLDESFDGNKLTIKTAEGATFEIIMVSSDPADVGEYKYTAGDAPIHAEDVHVGPVDLAASRSGAFDTVGEWQSAFTTGGINLVANGGSLAIKNIDVNPKAGFGGAEDYRGIGVDTGIDSAEVDTQSENLTLEFDAVKFPGGVNNAELLIGALFNGVQFDSGNQEIVKWEAYDGAVLVASGQIVGDLDGLVTLDIDTPVNFNKIVLTPLNNGAGSSSGNNSDFLLVNVEVCEQEPVKEEFGYTLRDGDGDESSAALKICVEDTYPTVPQYGNLCLNVDEDGLPAGIGNSDSPNDAPGNSATASGNIPFTPGADPVTIELSIGNGGDTGLKTLAGQTVLGAWDAATSTLIGYIAGTDPSDAANQVFKMTVTDHTTGAVTFDLLKPIKHADTDQGGDNTENYPDPTLVVNVQIEDKDCDVAFTTVHVKIDDDMPVICEAERSDFRLATDETLGGGKDVDPDPGFVRENDEEEIDVPPALEFASRIGEAQADASDLFHFDAGADGLQSVGFALTILGGGATGLIDTQTNTAIVLVAGPGGIILGKANGGAGETVLAFHVDSDGEVTMAQYRAVKHTDNNNHDAEIFMAPGALGVTMSVTDKDNDTVSLTKDISCLVSIDDDGPKFKKVDFGHDEDGDRIDEDNLPIVGNGDNAPGDDQGGIHTDGTIEFEFGSDKAGTLSIESLTITDSDGDPISLANLHTADGRDITINKSAPDGNGVVTWSAVVAAGETGAGQPVFTLTLDTAGANIGAFNFDLHQALEHPYNDNNFKNNGPDTTYEDNLKFDFTIKATDGDADHTTGHLTFNIDDDSPNADKVKIKLTGGEGNDNMLVHDESAGVQNKGNGSGAPDLDASGVDEDDISPAPADFAAFEAAKTPAAAIGYAQTNVAVNLDASGSGDAQDAIGADRPGEVSGLSLTNSSGGNVANATATSVFDTATGFRIYLYTEVVGSETFVVGRVGTSASGTSSGNANGAISFALHVSEGGTIEVGQYRAIKHPNTGSDDDAVTLLNSASNGAVVYITVTVTDADGDSVKVTKPLDGGSHGAGSIVFQDDGPKANNDTDSVTEDSAEDATGNVITGINPENAALGTDSNGTDGVKDEPGTDGYMANSVQWSDGGGIDSNGNIVGKYGTLFVDTNGEYKYVLDEANKTVDALNDKQSLEESFTYFFKDGDGDKTSGTLTIKIDGHTDAFPPTAEDATAFVDEDGLKAGLNDSQPGDNNADLPPDTVAGEAVFHDLTLPVVWNGNVGTISLTAGVWTGLLTIDGHAIIADPASTATLLRGIDAVTLQPVFEIEILNHTTGEYEVRLLKALLHPDSNNNPADDVVPGDDGTGSFEDNVTIPVNVKYTNIAGDADQLININVDDDSPVINWVSGPTVVLDDEGSPLLGYAGIEGAATPANDVLGAPDTVQFLVGASGGADGIKEYGFNATLTAAANTLRVTDGTADGAAVSYAIEGGDLVARVADATSPLNGQEVLRVGASAGGLYTVIQSLPLFHSGQDEINDIDFKIVAKVTDNDGDAVETTVTVKVDDDSPVAGPDQRKLVAPIVLDESAAGVDPDGVNNAPAGRSSWTVNYAANFVEPQFGADGKAESGSVSYALQLTGPDVPSGIYALSAGGTGQGTQIVLNQAGNTITGSADGQDYFTITVDPTDGDVTFTQLKNVWHANTGSDDDASTLTLLTADLLTLVQTVKDGDGDTDSAAINLGQNVFQIEDDGPTANNDTDTVTEGFIQPATGNVITGKDGGLGVDENGEDGVIDTAGTDGLNSIEWQGAVGTTVAGKYGTLHIDANGNYKYELNESDPDLNDLDTGEFDYEQFNYTIKDGDGDTASANLKIKINGLTEDKTPINYNDAAAGDEPGQDKNNVMIIFDHSGSMDADADGVPGGATRLQLARAAVEALLNKFDLLGDVKVNMVIFAENATAMTFWGTVTDALAFLDNPANHNPLGSFTSYSDALAAAGTSLVTNTTGMLTGPDVKTNVYFLSDGIPTADGATPGTDNDDPHNLTVAQQTAWNTALETANVDKVFAVGVGGDIPVGDDDLEAVASPNGNANNDPVGQVVIVDDENDLAAVLTDTVEGQPIDGNVLDGSIGVENPGTPDFPGDAPAHIAFFSYTDPNLGNGNKSISFTWNGNPASALVVAGAAPISITDQTAVFATEHGEMTFYFKAVPGHAAGDFAFIPNSISGNLDATETFKYYTRDLDGDIEPGAPGNGLPGAGGATLVITINNINQGPVAVNDSANGTEGQVVTIPFATLLSNDTDPDGDSLIIQSVQAAVNGSVLIVGTDVKFTPTAGYFGPASFTYTIFDGSLASTATVNLVIASSNVAPVGNIDHIYTNSDDDVTVQSAWLLANDTDADGDPLKITSVDENTNKIASLNEGGLPTSFIFNLSNDNTSDGSVADFTYDLNDGEATTVVGAQIHLDQSGGVINGSDGNDIIIAFDAAARGGLGDDRIVGNGTSDTLDYSDVGGDWNLTLGASGKGTASVPGQGTDTYEGIENLMGGSGKNELTGNTGSNFLTGNGGDDKLDGGNDAVADTLSGGDGNDTLIWRTNADTYNGGANGDILDVSGTASINFTGFTDGLIENIEALKLAGGSGTTVTLSANDVINFEGGTFDPTGSNSGKNYDSAAVLTITGETGDAVNLTSGKDDTWFNAETNGATGVPAGFTLYVHVTSGAIPAVNENAYVLIQDDVTVNLS